MGIKQSSQNIRGCCRKLSGTSHGRFAYPLYSKDIETGEWLLNDIWQGGNFGQHNQNRKQRPKGYWSGKWYTFTRATQRCREFGALAPAEARWYPLMLAVHSAQVQWNKMWNRN